jgi:hypothetical protein
MPKMLVSVVAWMLCVSAVAHGESDTLSVGVAKVDITPSGPIRLCGYAARTKESEGVE